MGHPVHTPRKWGHRRHVLGRTRHRPWVRPSDLRYANALLGRIPTLPRAALSRLTMLMIDRMDEIDGDPDLEDLRDDDEDPHDREQEQAYE